MDNFLDDYFSANFMSGVQNVVIALLVLLVGWIIAKAIGNAVERGMQKTALDEKLFDKILTGDKQVDSNKVVGKIVYYILLVVAFMLFFNILNLNAIANPLSDLIGSFFSFIPTVLSAALILLLAWVIASLVQWLIVKGTEKAKIQQFLFKIKVADTIEDVKRFMETIGKVVFYFILLLFIPGVLQTLNLAGVAQPFTSLLDSILLFIPKLIAALLIFAIGWFIAKIIKNIVVNLLEAVGSEKLIAKLKLQKLFEGSKFATVVGNIVFVVIMIPITITALEKIELAGITTPAISMLQDVMNMIPNIIIAVALVLVGVWLGKLIGGFVHDFLSRLGFDRLTSKMQLGQVDATPNKMTASAVVGYVVQVLIVFFLTVQALYLVKLDFLVGIATAITAYLPHVLVAVLILGIALIVGNILEKVLLNLLSGPAIKLLAGFAKYAIVVLAIFMALTQLGIAPTIVNAAFIIILAGLALAFGLAFGFGGKDFASKYLDKFDHTIEETNVTESNGEDTNPNNTL